VVAGAGAPDRPPPGRPGLPPHAPASWQGAWMSDTSSVRRRPAWHPDRRLGTPQTPWPYPWASAARNGRNGCNGTRRWPLIPPGWDGGRRRAGLPFYADATLWSREGARILQRDRAPGRPAGVKRPIRRGRARSAPAGQASPAGHTGQRDGGRLGGQRSPLPVGGDPMSAPPAPAARLPEPLGRGPSPGCCCCCLACSRSWRPSLA
jgi:hypothetical protein